MAARALLGAAVWALVARAGGEDVLALGDECGAAGDEACAVNALQMRVRKATSSTAEATTGPNEDLVRQAAELTALRERGDIGPALQADIAGVPDHELGADEQVWRARQVESEDDGDAAPARRLSVPRPKTKAHHKDAPTTPAPPEIPVGIVQGNFSVPAGPCFLRAYTGARQGNELCFCQLAAGDKTCSSTGCACPQGCTGITWEHPATVTFKNKARAENCGPSTVLLTAPRAYYKDPQDLKSSGCAVDVVKSLLVDSWITYQATVGTGKVWQCFHSSKIASVKYLHLQTFCADGKFHGMPTTDTSVGNCAQMSSMDEVPALADQLAANL